MISCPELRDLRTPADGLRSPHAGRPLTRSRRTSSPSAHPVLRAGRTKLDTSLPSHDGAHHRAHDGLRFRRGASAAPGDMTVRANQHGPAGVKAVELGKACLFAIEIAAGSY